MIELWRAIDNYFKTVAKAAAFNAALTGGLHDTETPQKVTYPYATFQVITDTADNFASAGYHTENCLMQFNLFSKKRSRTEILTLFDLLKDSLDFIDDSTMTIENYRLIQAMRETMIPLPRLEGVHQINVTYRLLLEPA